MNALSAEQFAILLLTFICLLLIFWRSQPRRARTRRVIETDAAENASLPLRQEEKELIEHFRDFQDSIVREVMVPRIDIVAVEESATLEHFRLLALEKGHSRIPVYHGTVDQIIGIAYMKDMLRFWGTDSASATVTAIMRPPYFVPETKQIRTLLREFQASKVHIAIAIDEYGGTAGIVTIEDVLSVFFGDIADEHDEHDAEPIRRIDENTFEVNAKAAIDEFEAIVGDLGIEQQEFDTVGGLLFAISGDVPQEQDVITYRHLKFTVLKADKHRILQIKVERLPEPPAE